MLAGFIITIGLNSITDTYNDNRTIIQASIIKIPFAIPLSVTILFYKSLYAMG
jgi:hypothetical protein